MNFGRSAKKTVEFRALIAAAALLSAGSWLKAQAPPAPPQSQQQDQNKPADKQKPANANPFPEDTNTVPVLPSSNQPAAPEAPAAASEPAPPLPSGDVDPVRSPDEPPPDATSSTSSSSGMSSSSADLGRILEPPPDDETHSSRKGKNSPPPEHQETAHEDESVGSYYLDQKNWRAALSRFQSALVLDPENPDVYWGLAESQRHLGDTANAKSNYVKVLEYDPDSKHAKEAKKLLKDPEMAKAPAAPPSR